MVAVQALGLRVGQSRLGRLRDELGACRCGCVEHTTDREQVTEHIQHVMRMADDIDDEKVVIRSTEA